LNEKVGVCFIEGGIRETGERESDHGYQTEDTGTAGKRSRDCCSGRRHCTGRIGLKDRPCHGSRSGEEDEGGPVEENRDQEGPNRNPGENIREGAEREGES
jgi:hypothetical protein